jgi:hypothetical protein
MRELFSFLLLAFTLGCETPTEATQPLGRHFDVRHGQSVRVEGGLTVAFLRVAADSRCPSDVQCIQAGEARVVLELRHGGDRVESELATSPRGEDDGEQDEIDGFSVRLVDVKPYPRSTSPTAPEDYVVTLEANRH